MKKAILMAMFSGFLTSCSSNQRIISRISDLGGKAEDCDRGVCVFLPDVLFESGKSKLNGEVSEKVAEYGKVIQEEDQKSPIAIEGHTDSDGSDESNLKLSDKRSKRVKTLLEHGGLAKGRAATKAYGEAKPLVPNTSDARKARNRRVEVVIENPSWF